MDEAAQALKALKIEQWILQDKIETLGRAIAILSLAVPGEPMLQPSDSAVDARKKLLQSKVMEAAILKGILRAVLYFEFTDENGTYKVSEALKAQDNKLHALAISYAGPETQITDLIDGGKP